MEVHDGIVQSVPWIKNNFDENFLKEIALDIEAVEYPILSTLSDMEPALYFLLNG